MIIDVSINRALLFKKIKVYKKTKLTFDKHLPFREKSML